MMREKLMFLAFVFFTAIEANLEVMKVINDSQERLRIRGFFDRTLDRDSIFNQPQKCTDGFVTLEGENFACENINFLSFLSMKDLEISEPAHRASVGVRAADIWGWLSPTNREFTLLALDNGAVVIDSTDATNPCIIAKLPTRRIVDKWGDVKVFQNTMYHVKDTGISDNSPSAPEGNAEYGIEVYDLLQLDQIDCSVTGYVPMNLFPQFVFEGHGRSHNVEVNTQSGRLYSIGSEKCAGGPVILDLNEDPLRPTQIGCLDMDGYTHDIQCLNYDGPDQDHTGKEICFAFNEDTLTIFDVTDAANVVQISRTPYPNQVYSHQGWTNNDLTKILLDDELDEVCNQNMQASLRCAAGNALSGELRTTTNVFNIVDLDNPVFEQAYIHPEEASDHNLYVWGHIHRTGQGGNPPMENFPNPNFAYFNNYLAGLKVVDISDDDVSNWEEVGTFDISPEITEIEFAGAWSGYMHPSGVYAISSIERGLFLLDPEMAFAPVENPVPSPTDPPVDAPVPSEPPVDAPVPSEPPVDAPVPSEPPVDAPTPSQPPLIPPTPSQPPVGAPSPSQPPVDAPTDGSSSGDDEREIGPVLAAITGFILITAGIAALAVAFRKKMSNNNANNDEAAQEEGLPPSGKVNPMENISTANPIFREEP